MSQIRGAQQGDRELAQRMSYPGIDGYAAAGAPGARTTIVNGPAQEAGQYTTNQAFGAYQRDSHAAQEMRNFYDTMDAVANRSEANDTNAVQRTANITGTEMDLMREFQETEKTKKWEQYWWSTADPSKPWTMTELNKIDPALVQRKIDAIQEVSQFALDKAIIEHLGHNGDPRLAQLQYMLDQGQMAHMPSTVVIDNTPYTRGPLSLFGLSQGADASYSATSVTLPRQAFNPAAVADRARIDRGSGPLQKNLFTSAAEVARRAGIPMRPATTGPNATPARPGVGFSPVSGRSING
ncbi:hypothetical protein T492DRAFT_894600 [Pavlovales sp. CCMP2436]|nr:hypothetical protein T492DRAFT_894600 [Pavlovales sp. CCMP2436]